MPADPRVVVSGNFATPFTTLAILDATVEKYTLNVLNAQGDLPKRDGVTLETSFVGPAMRKDPRLRYVPCRLSLLPLLFESTLRPDVVLVHTSLPTDGTVSLGTEVNVLPAAIEATRAHGGIIVAQANPRMPTTFGDSQLGLDQIDYLIEVDEPLATHNPAEPDDTSRLIGDRIAHLVPDGATLQLGIGGVPDAVLAALVNRKQLRVWSEMFSDGVLTLRDQGALDPDEPVTASFAFGSAALYEWIDGNRGVRMVRTEKANDPAVIARRPAMTSVNTALQVDLFGQANASRINAQIYSGFGGQTDFIVGALHAPGGQAFIALRSWHPKANVSTVVPLIDEPVTSFQHTAIVTEFGLAPIWGHSQGEQARAIIENIAHPDAREDLWEEAAAMRLV